MRQPRAWRKDTGHPVNAATKPLRQLVTCDWSTTCRVVAHRSPEDRLEIRWDRPGFFGECALGVLRGWRCAWYLAKLNEPRPYIGLLNAALAFAVEHGLTDVYRTRFGGISSGDISPGRAKAEGRGVDFPIQEIANELLVARYLERVFGWRLVEHEPRGDKDRRGDWQFLTPRGRAVFVEVKSLAEPEWQGVFTPNFSPRLRRLLARAYRQLPADGRGVLVVLVGGLTLDAPAGNRMLGHLFGALFGTYQITFQVMPFDPNTVQGGPSFWDMLVQSEKHRRLGCVAALQPGGLLAPELDFYAIHNPYADAGARLAPEDMDDANQFVVGADGRGSFVGNVDAAAWPKLAAQPGP